MLTASRVPEAMRASFIVRVSGLPLGPITCVGNAREAHTLVLAHGP